MYYSSSNNAGQSSSPQTIDSNGNYTVSFNANDINGTYYYYAKDNATGKQTTQISYNLYTPPIPQPVNPIVPNQSNTSIVGVYYPAGNPNYPSGIKHVFRLKNGKSSHYFSFQAVLSDNFNHTEIIDMDYNTFINNYTQSSGISDFGVSIKKEASNPDIYLVIEANPSGEWGKYKRRFATPSDLDFWMKYFNLTPETVPDGTLSSLPQGKDIVKP